MKRLNIEDACEFFVLKGGTKLYYRKGKWSDDAIIEIGSLLSVEFSC